MSRNIIISAAAKPFMSQPPTPFEAAPAYDEHLDRDNDEHPVNAHPPSGSATGYTTVSQTEPDIELARDHSVPFNPFAPHQHCETCDALTTAREERAKERHDCMWISIVFMTIFLASALLGIVIVSRR